FIFIQHIKPPHKTKYVFNDSCMREIVKNKVNFSLFLCSVLALYFPSFFEQMYISSMSHFLKFFPKFDRRKVCCSLLKINSLLTTIDSPSIDLLYYVVFYTIFTCTIHV